MSDNRNMKIYTAKELYERLTQADECVWIEAKGEDDTSNDKYVENYIEFYGTLYRIMKVDSAGDLKLVKIENEKFIHQLLF